jgi:hypothetical protein
MVGDERGWVVRSSQSVGRESCWGREEGSIHRSLATSFLSDAASEMRHQAWCSYLLIAEK